MPTTTDTERWVLETRDPQFLPRLREALKRRKISAASLGRRVGKSASWAAAVIRGDVPYRGAGYVPKGFWRAVHSLGLVAPPPEAMRRTAEILDTATDQFKKTGRGAVFIGEAECTAQFKDLTRADAGPGARFVVDWKDENGDILETFGLTEDGFRALVGEEPLTAEEYDEADARHWDAILTAGELS
jgi:hypothetical protein